MDKPVSEIAKEGKGDYSRQVYESQYGAHAVFDYVVRLLKFRRIYEIKGIRWGMPSYATRSGVSSLLSKMGKQVRRHLAVKKEEDVYEVVFYEMPLYEWQKEMVLKWAGDFGIILSFERPRGL